jgi:hypothetical protein
MGVVSGLRFSEDGWRIGFTLNSPRSPGNVHSFRVGETELTQWTEQRGRRPVDRAVRHAGAYPVSHVRLRGRHARRCRSPGLTRSTTAATADAQAEESAGSQDARRQASRRQPVPDGERVPALRAPTIPAFTIAPAMKARIPCSS